MATTRRKTSIGPEPVRYMEKLDDLVLIEILRRLPDAKSAIRCKLVSSHWNSVISSPHFSAIFLDHPPEKQFANIISQRSNSRRSYTVFSNDSNFQGFDYNFALSFLKSTPSNHKTLELQILATYNELLLCLHTYRRVDADECEIMKFYVCSPLTKHHVALPPPPACPRYSTHGVVGLLCRGRSSFRVVFVVGVTMYIFSCEDNKWTEHRLGVDGNEIVSDHGVMALAWNGVLCWKSLKSDRLVFCNPYSTDRERFHFIATPPEAQKTFSHGVGVFRGTLRFWHLWRRTFSVWDLKDYNTQEWSLKYQVRRYEYDYIGAPVFDPNDEDVAYYVGYRDLLSLNMRSGDSSRVRASFKTSVNIRRGEVKVNLFMPVMSGFPTPITTFPQNAIASDDIAMPFDRITRSRAQNLQKAMNLNK